jgi:hypothetical protein
MCSIGRAKEVYRLSWQDFLKGEWCRGLSIDASSEIQYKAGKEILEVQQTSIKTEKGEKNGRREEVE